MGQTRCCPFCGGGKKLTAEWAYLRAGQTKACTAVLTVRCKWCKGTGVRQLGQPPEGPISIQGNPDL